MHPATYANREMLAKRTNVEQRKGRLFDWEMEKAKIWKTRENMIIGSSAKHNINGKSLEWGNFTCLTNRNKSYKIWYFSILFSLFVNVYLTHVVCSVYLAYQFGLCLLYLLTMIRLMDLKFYLNPVY